MAVMSPVDIVNNYFFSWKEYDIDLLTKIFHPKATYNIKPIHQVLTGIEEICRYWERNKKRQRNIIVEWEIIKTTLSSIDCEFNAEFWDNEESEQQRISGNISFVIIDGIIYSLSETYQKTVLG